MSEKTKEQEALDRAMRRLFAAKEMIDAAIEAVADVLVSARPEGSLPAEETRPATFGQNRIKPAETASDVPGWQEGVTKSSN